MNSQIVYIVDDDEAVRDSLALLCESEGLEVKGYDSAESFLKDFCLDMAGCLILDVRMGGMNGPKLQSELKLLGNPMPVIYLTGHGDIPMSVQAMKEGAFDFLTKPVDGTKLLELIQAALSKNDESNGQRALTANQCRILERLTSREREVMALAIAGQTNKEIARQIGISFRTVETHRAKIFHKTATKNLLELAGLASRCGLRSLTK